MEAGGYDGSTPARGRSKGSSSSIAAADAAVRMGVDEAAAQEPSSPGWSITCWPGAPSQGDGSGRSSCSGTTRSLRCGIPGAQQRRRRRRRRARWRGLALYLLPRLALLAYFGAWMAALPASGAFDLHLHHYALGWALASLAAFNHPASGLALALGAAVFVQGVGAYGLDPFFKSTQRPPGGCLPVSSNQTGQMVCAFWAADPFALKFCSGGHSIHNAQHGVGKAGGGVDAA